MPFGAFKLNSIARYIASQVAGGRTAATITANTATISTTQSKFGGSSASFPGTPNTQSLVVTNWDSSGITTQFTWECWVYFNAINVYSNLWMQGTGSSTQDFHRVYCIFSNGGAEANRLYIALGVSGNASYLFAPYTWAANTWYHIAISRDSSNDIRFYVNGTQIGTTQNNSRTWVSSITNDRFDIGRFRDGAGLLNGYLDELRISKVARYTSTSFGLPITSFTNDPDTTVLIHADGTNASTTFTDDANNRIAQTVTPVGDAKISTTQYKFGSSSISLDGTGDYLKIVPTLSSDLAIGIGDFTIEFWVRFNNTGSGIILDTRGTGNRGNTWTLYISSNTIRWYVNFADRITSSSLSVDTWYHVAVVRSGSDHKLYINGTQSGSTWNNSTSYQIGTDTDGLFFGYNQPFPGTALNAFLDEIRISNVARYLGNFTAPTAAFTNDGNTKLLLHGEGANNSTTITDDNIGGNGTVSITRPAQTITLFGNTQISTAQSKFGGASVYLDGTGDYFRIIPLSQKDLAIGGENFTIEFWARFNSLTGAVLDTRGVSNISNTWVLYFNTNTLRWYVGSTDRITSSTLSTNTWYHIAIVRSGNDHKLYINGTQSGSTYTSDQNYTIGSITNGLGIGENQPFPPGNINAYIDEFRISNIARYTANFTAPTSAFVNDSNTRLLIHGNGANTSTAITDDNS